MFAQFKCSEDLSHNLTNSSEAWVFNVWLIQLKQIHWKKEKLTNNKKKHVIDIITYTRYAYHHFLFHGVKLYGPLTKYVKLRVAHVPGMPGTFSPPPRVSDPGMHNGTCVTHVPWCISGSQTGGFLWSGGGKTFPTFPAHTQPTILRIW